MAIEEKNIQERVDAPKADAQPRSPRSRINESRMALAKLYEEQKEEIENLPDVVEDEVVTELSFIAPTDEFLGKVSVVVANIIDRLKDTTMEAAHARRLLDSGALYVCDLSDSLAKEDFLAKYASIVEREGVYTVDEWLKFGAAIVAGDEEHGAFNIIPFIFEAPGDEEGVANNAPFVALSAIDPNGVVMAYDFILHIDGGKNEEFENVINSLIERLVKTSTVGIHEATSKTCGVHGYKKYEGKMLCNMSKEDIRSAIREEKKELAKLKSERKAMDESDKKGCKACDKEIKRKQELIEVLDERLEYLRGCKKATKTNESQEAPSTLNEKKDEEEPEEDKEPKDDKEPEEEPKDDTKDEEGDEDDKPQYEEKFVRFKSKNVDGAIEFFKNEGIKEKDIQVAEREEGEDDEPASGVILVPLKYREKLDEITQRLWGKTLEDVSGTVIEEEPEDEEPLTDDDILNIDDFDFGDEDPDKE